MIAEIRSYLKAKISDVDSELTENPSAFFDNDIGESLIGRSYQITINDLVKVTRNSHIERTMSAVISIFGFGYRDQVSNYDELLCKAIEIEDKITDLQNFSGIETITNIESIGINASKFDSNDDVFQIDITLTITQAYSRE